MPKILLKIRVNKDGKEYVALYLKIGISGFGDTREKAIASLKEALGLYFEDTPGVNIQKMEIEEKTFKETLEQRRWIEEAVADSCAIESHDYKKAKQDKEIIKLLRKHGRIFF